MEALVSALAALGLVAGLVAFDLLALRFGVDSREAIGDDHTRRVRTSADRITTEPTVVAENSRRPEASG